MSGALLMRGATTLAGDLALLLRRHGCESSTFLTRFVHGALLLPISSQGTCHLNNLTIRQNRPISLAILPTEQLSGNGVVNGFTTVEVGSALDQYGRTTRQG